MSKTVPLNGALAERYTLERELGHGGMATVYLARDARHDRPVAVKVVHSDLTASLGAERFLAEIRTTANLQHPHILPLHDSGEADGHLFYVMPFVEGESLRARLEREGPLPIDEAVRITTEVLSALAYAHRHGVVHRDIKPENILLHDGTALVADFGIALAVQTAASSRMTQTGLSLGTPQYMSPEQAMGEKHIDGRADVYATGAVLYEMLTGDPPFSGSSVQAIVAKVMTERPTPPSTVRDTVPPNVEAAVLKSLAKLPADRFASAKEFADALTGQAATTTSFTRATPVAHRDERRLVRIAIALAVLAAASLTWAAALFVRSRRVTPSPIARFELPLGGQSIVPGRSMLYNGPAIALSRDGNRIAFIGRDSTGATRVWARTLGELDPRPVPGTEGAVSVALSPDGRAAAFIVNKSLRSVQLDGGAVTTLAPEANDLAWAADGRIYFVVPNANVTGSSIERIGTSGGSAEPVVSDTSSLWLTDPVLLPGGKALLVGHLGGGRGASTNTVFAVDLATKRFHLLVRGHNARFVAPNRIVYIDPNGVLRSMAFDPGTLEVSGPAIQLVPGGRDMPSAVSQFAASEKGALLYLTTARPDREFVWVNREGKEQPVDSTLHGPLGFFALSPDGTRVAFDLAGAVWLEQLDHGPRVKLVLRGGSYLSWTGDGSSVCYDVADSTGVITSAFRTRADGTGQATRVLPLGTSVTETDWSRDGRWLVFRTSERPGGTGSDIYAVRASADTAPTALLHTRANERQPVLSPDSRFLAYVSDETGRNEVYVVPFPNVTESRWTVSTNGGSEPLWSPKGDELFFRDAADNFVSVSIRTTPTFTLGVSRVLFSAAQYQSYPGHRMYEVSPDGQRFLMQRSPRRTATRLVLVQNWANELRRAAERAR